MTPPSHPRPGAAILITRRGGKEARRLATRPFELRHETPRVWSEGPIAVAWLEEGERGLHVTDRTVCLLEGALYDIPGVEPTVDPGGSPAARLTQVYERFGEDVLPRLRGEFWALLWSRQRMEGIVLTDQIGSSVPYWAAAVDGMIVASEVPELLDCLPRHPPPDELALAHWLMMTGPRAGTTLFAGVQRLRAGHLLRLSPGGGRSERYWAPIPHQPLGASRDDQARRLLEALELAVQRRCPSEVPAGILLSGGLDSSTVAALAAREGAVRAYSAVFPDHPAMDESSLIERMAEHVGIHSTRLVVRQGSTLSGALDYLRAWKLPPTSPNLFFWAPLLERAAADGVRVMLDGEGGDELFAFSPYLVADRLLHGRLRSALALSRRWPGESTPPSRDLLRLRLHLAGARPLVPAVAHRLVRRARGVEHYAPSWLPDGLAGRWLETENSSFAWKEITGPRWWAYIVDLVTRGAGPSVVYEQARRRGRLAGVAARHPLVDADVIELVLRLDPELAFDSRFPRAMLREAIVGLVPDEVRLRRGKSNFDALFHQLLAGPELPAVQALLDPRRSQLGHYIDMAAIDADLLRERPLGGRALGRWAAQVWRLVTAECWLRSQADADGLERLRGELALPGAEPVFEVSPSG